MGTIRVIDKAWFTAGGVIVMAACGGSTTAQQEPSTPAAAATVESAASRAPAHEMPIVEQEIGGLDEHMTRKVFASSIRAFERCQDDRRRAEPRLDFLAGEFKAEVRVKRDGTARYAILTHSTIGDREVERCIEHVLASANWPKPLGGEGLAKNEFELVMKADREPVQWSASKVAKSVEAARSSFAVCGRAARRGYEITAYIDTDGAVVSAGANEPSDAASSTADCVASVARDLNLPSPGGWPAKVTFAVP